MRLPGATVTFTTRQGGVSEGPYESLNLGALTEDVPEHVVENRRRAAARAGVAPERMAMGYQVHGTDIREWTEPPTDRAFPDVKIGSEDAVRIEIVLDRELQSDVGEAIARLLADPHITSAVVDENEQPEA